MGVAIFEEEEEGDGERGGDGRTVVTVVGGGEGDDEDVRSLNRPVSDLTVEPDSLED